MNETSSELDFHPIEITRIDATAYSVPALDDEVGDGVVGEDLGGTDAGNSSSDDDSLVTRSIHGEFVSSPNLK